MVTRLRDEVEGASKGRQGGAAVAGTRDEAGVGARVRRGVGIGRAMLGSQTVPLEPGLETEEEQRSRRGSRVIKYSRREQFEGNTQLVGARPLALPSARTLLLLVGQVQDASRHVRRCCLRPRSFLTEISPLSPLLLARTRSRSAPNASPSPTRTCVETLP